MGLCSASFSSRCHVCLCVLPPPVDSNMKPDHHQDRITEQPLFQSRCFYLFHPFTFVPHFPTDSSIIISPLALLSSETKGTVKTLKCDESQAARDDKSHRRRGSALLTSTKASYLHTSLFISAMGLFFLICGLLLKASLKIQGLFSMYLITVIFNIKSLWAATAIIKSVLCQSSLLILTLLKTSPLGYWQWSQLTGLFGGCAAKEIIALCRRDPIRLWEVWAASQEFGDLKL